LATIQERFGPGGTETQTLEQALAEHFAQVEYDQEEREAREQWAKIPTAEQQDEEVRRFKQRTERDRGWRAYRARKKARAVLGGGRVAAVSVRVLPAAAPRERRDRTRPSRAPPADDDPDLASPASPPPTPAVRCSPGRRRP
jgi:hypothetical protein